jgi:acyl-CoA synthetase (AMP-forming)/AMP-acid ligase II
MAYKQVMVQRFEPAHVLRLIQEERATAISLVPTMANSLLNCPELGNSGGESISSIEVEKAVYAHPAVMECAVFATPDPKWGEVPAAVIVVKNNRQLEREAVLAFLCGRIAGFKMPRIVEFTRPPLPKTGTGNL